MTERLSKSGNQKPLLMSQEALQGFDIASGEIHVFLGPHRGPLLNSIFGLGQSFFHARLFGYHVAAKSEAGSALLLLQVIEAAVNSGSTVGKLVNLGLELIQVRRAARVAAGCGRSAVACCYGIIALGNDCPRASFA